jgi:hypothetical protein
VDLASPACAEQLLETKDHPLFVGVRHVTQDELDDDFIVSRPAMQGLRVLELQFRRNSAARLGLAGFGRGCGLVVEQAAGFRQGAFASFAFQTQGHFRVL